MASLIGEGREEDSDSSGAGFSLDTARLLWLRYGAVVSFLTLLLFAVGYGTSYLVRSYIFGCIDPGCMAPNAALERSLADVQGDPCEDFYGYVCGGGRGRTRAFPAISTKRDRFDARLQALQQKVATAAILSLVLEEGDSELPSQLVSRLFLRCAQIAFSQLDNLDELRSFLHRFHLSWPDPMPRSKLETLDVMVALSLDWGIPVLFQLSVDTYFKRRGYRILHLSASPYVTDWFTARNALRQKGTLRAYIERASLILNGLAPVQAQSGRGGCKMASIVLELDNHILTAVMPSLVDPHPDSDLLYLQIGQMEDTTTPYLSAGEWLKVINEHLPIELGMADEMFLTNRRLLRLVAVLVGSVGDTTALLAYVTWHVTRILAFASSFQLSHAEFADERGSDYATLGHIIGHCYSDANTVLPHAFSYVFNRRWLSKAIVGNATAMVNTIRDVAKATIKALSWMDDETKRHAVEKLTTLATIVGSPQSAADEGALRNLYPWLRYSKRFLRFKGSPSEEAGIPLTMVNAFYLPVYHVMILPAAILYPPFYVANYPDSYNFGALGHVVGHEITHTFDPEVGLYDRDGIRRDWWTPTARVMFESKLACLSGLYRDIPGSGGAAFGDRSLPENFADSGGMLKAYTAYRAAGRPSGGLPFGRHGLTDEQLFFAGSCFKWCSNEGGNSSSRYSPPRLRCNVPLLNMPEFAQAFECGAGKAMNPGTRCDSL
ncbi:hypothetical protein HPB48_010423 [Haemaphysalis longicornis]|uniref:Uncharacterized protein n=1 Tax=Haemaphysalis longicornis TaxID=44386 RepID=A0A9J6H674_HAELO|nr:hypothetical protein HPB48_010423 [Haemaphysalis longicornis]